MNAQQNRLDTISNNLANVDTAGFKRDVSVSKSFPELLLRRTEADGVYKTPFGSADVAPIIGKLGLGVETNENFTEFEQGSFRGTNTNTDMALAGEGSFAVETPNGERYTRNGNFILGKEGLLLTKDGYPLMGENGYIRVPDDKFIVNEDGIITTKDNEVIDPLKSYALTTSATSKRWETASGTPPTFQARPTSQREWSGRKCSRATWRPAMSM